MEKVDTLIIGASAAGLSCAACLKKQNLDFVLLEEQAEVGRAWRNHYDRLHLHTNKSTSFLPYLPFPKSFPKYLSKAQLVEYLELYLEKMDIKPVFHSRVEALQREGIQWIATTKQKNYVADRVIVATGNAHTPYLPTKEGLSTFTGEVMHSTAYKNGKAFKDKEVLIVGFGNSACEIALCLHEHGAKPALSVRAAVNVIPREILGISVLQISILLSALPSRVTDRLNQPVLDLILGDIRKLGLQKLPYGPMEQIREHHKIPVLDIGILKLIREGKVKIMPGIRKVDGQKVYFEDGQSQEVDAIILATGYRHALSEWVRVEEERLTELYLPLKHRQHSGKDGLYFCGFYLSPHGMLREIRLEAKAIAKDIKRKTQRIMAEG